jgi:hypothetical protein
LIHARREFLGDSGSNEATLICNLPTVDDIIFDFKAQSSSPCYEIFCVLMTIKVDHAHPINHFRVRL